MGRLIDADVLVDTISKKYSTDGTVNVLNILRMITDQPERKPGKWIHDGYDHPHGVDWMHCSECGKKDVWCPAARTNFCPNCGADMRGEQE